ncbi:MAG: tRNA (guanosine(46)-N7)-methyltransferase TrmB [Flavobacteriales bacterium]
MGKDKLKRFSQMLTFENVIQPEINFYSKDDDLKGNWSAVFNNQNPVVLELGCGAGEYTVALAKHYPKRNFIGVDIKGARIWKGAKSAIEEDLDNVRFLRTKVDFVTKFFGENEVDEIWLTFSDPQPKKPKKRLTSNLFIDRYLKFLKPNGVVHLKTDSELLYDFTLEEIKSNGFELLKNITNVYKDSYEDSQDLKKVLFIKTFYEKKWIELGKTIKYLGFKIHPKRI